MRVVILNYQFKEVIEDIFRKILTSKLEENLHGLQIPKMSC